jgi:hypothetical protein
MPNGIPEVGPVSKPRNRLALGITLLALLVIGILIYLFWPRTIDCGTSKTCFLDAANACKSAVVREQLTGGTVIKYQSNGCVITKSIERFADNESSTVVSALQGKTMTCSYDKNNLDPTTIAGLMSGSCQGNLLDALTELQAASMLVAR